MKARSGLLSMRSIAGFQQLGFVSRIIHVHLADIDLDLLPRYRSPGDNEGRAALTCDLNPRLMMSQ
jgi:hypothetical protein